MEQTPREFISVVIFRTLIAVRIIFAVIFMCFITVFLNLSMQIGSSIVLFSVVVAFVHNSNFYQLYINTYSVTTEVSK